MPIYIFMTLEGALFLSTSSRSLGTCGVPGVSPGDEIESLLDGRVDDGRLGDMIVVALLLLRVSRSRL